MTLLLVYVGAALGFSFLCSLLEASFLSARLVTLTERKDAGHRGAARLLELKSEQVDDSLSAILILNTVANTAGATLAGAQAKTVFGDLLVQVFPAVGAFEGFFTTAVGVFTAGFIIAILIGSEIVPKTLGAVYAERLVTFTGFTVLSLTVVLRPALYATRLVTRFLTRTEKTPISRRELSVMVSMAELQGTLRPDDSRLVSNVLKYHEIRVEDVMTPRTVISMLPASATLQTFLGSRDLGVYSRLPVFDESPDDILGYVLQRDLLAAAARDEPPETSVKRFLRKAHYIPQGQDVGRALRFLTESREHFALVTDEYGGISGLVSLEDLMETILGIEILDESDRVADLRAEAIKLRDKRLAELNRAPETS